MRGSPICDCAVICPQPRLTCCVAARCAGFLAIYLAFVVLVGVGRVVYVRGKAGQQAASSALVQQRTREQRVTQRARLEVRPAQSVWECCRVSDALPRRAQAAASSAAYSALDEADDGGIRKLRSRSHDAFSLLAARGFGQRSHA